MSQPGPNTVVGGYFSSSAATAAVIVDGQPVALQVDSAGNLKITGPGVGGAVVVGGPAVDDAAASGNPVPVGGIYRVTRPTYTDLDRTQLQSDTRGNIGVNIVGQNGVNGAATLTSVSDGNTLGTGLAVYNQPSMFNGTNVDRARSAVGSALVSTGIGATSVEEGGRTFGNISTATTVTLKSGPGHLHSVVLNTLVASGLVEIFDSLTATGTSIGKIQNPGTLLAQGPLGVIYDIAFATGLTIKTTLIQDVTVSYR